MFQTVEMAIKRVNFNHRKFQCNLVRLYLGRAAAGAFIQGHQFSAFHIKLFVLFNDPFVEPVLAQSLPFVLFLQGRFPEFDNFTHEYNLALFCCEFLL